MEKVLLLHLCGIRQKRYNEAEKDVSALGATAVMTLYVNPHIIMRLNKLLGLFYEAIFDNNQEKIARLRHVIGDCGYAAVIDDIKV